MDTAIRAEAASASLTLLTWFSPAFPIGAFAYSHGLEAAVAENRVAGADDLACWVETLLIAGSGWNDLVLLCAGMRAAADREALDDLSDLAQALAGSAERRAETAALGAAFAQAAAPWTGVQPARPYPLAVAAAARAVGLPAGDVILAAAHAFASQLVSAAVRLVPLGQSEAVAVMRRLEEPVARAARRAAAATADDLGSAALLSEIAAMRHETLSTRLFRS